MGILNVTPDSFSDGGLYLRPEAAVVRAKQIESEGADFIDIGGQSTRPGAEEISAEEELKRVVPVLKALAKEIRIPMSIDTYRSEVAEEALKCGALIVNDISALNFDKDMARIISKYKASAILMHIKGTPRDMQVNPEYHNLIAEVLTYLENGMWKANVEGIDQIIIDPGIGFGKSVQHNLHLIKNMYEFKKLDCPIMLGISRKSLIGKIDGSDIKERLSGTIALNTISILNGVNILRVHDVKEALRAARIVDEYKNLSKVNW
jgi:dihydropteroate synthase